LALRALGAEPAVFVSVRAASQAFLANDAEVGGGPPELAPAYPRRPYN